MKRFRFLNKQNVSIVSSCIVIKMFLPFFRKIYNLQTIIVGYCLYLSKDNANYQNISIYGQPIFELGNVYAKVPNC